MKYYFLQPSSCFVAIFECFLLSCTTRCPGVRDTGKKASRLLLVACDHVGAIDKCKQIERKAWDVQRLKLQTENQRMMEKVENFQRQMQKNEYEARQLKENIKVLQDQDSLIRKELSLKTAEWETERSNLRTEVDNLKKQEALKFDKRIKEQSATIHGLEAVLRNHEQCKVRIDALQQELEDSRFDLMESDRARSWLSHRLSTTSASLEKRVNEILTLKAVQSWKFRVTTGYLDRKFMSIRRKYKVSLQLKHILHRWKSISSFDKRKYDLMNHKTRWKEKKLSSFFLQLRAWSDYNVWCKINLIKFRMKSNQRSLWRSYKGWYRLWTMAKDQAIVVMKAIQRRSRSILIAKILRWSKYLERARYHRKILGPPTSKKSESFCLVLASNKDLSELEANMEQLQTEIKADILHSLAHVIPIEEASTRISVRNLCLDSSTQGDFIRTIIEYDASCKHALAEQVTIQSADKWSSLRLKGKWTSQVLCHQKIGEKHFFQSRWIQTLKSDYFVSWWMEARHQKYFKEHQTNKRSIDVLQNEIMQFQSVNLMKEAKIQKAAKKLLCSLKTNDITMAFNEWRLEASNRRQHKIEKAKRIKTRFHDELETAFDDFCSRVAWVKERKQICER
eukprot:445720-Hanusia_phi.AAC.1